MIVQKNGKENMSHNRLILFIGTMAAVMLIAAAATLSLNRIETGARAELRQSMETILQTSHQSLRTWFRDKESTAKVWAANEHLLSLTQALLQVPTTRQDLATAPAQRKMRDLLAPVFKSWGYKGFFLINHEDVNIASSRDINLGVTNLLVGQENFLERAWRGETLISMPLPSDVALRDYAGEMVEGLATMFAASAIRDAGGDVIAVLAFRLGPDETGLSGSVPKREAQALPDIGGRVLYVEDNPANLQLMEMIMDGMYGIEMISAHSAEMGIEMARSQKPHVILMDINLPGKDGFEALEKLLEYPETRTIPVIAISARATKRDIDKGVAAGFFEYLTKPIQVAAVTASIERALKQH